MAKFMVHTFQEVRVTYEIDADTAEDAQAKVEDHGWDMQPVAKDLNSAEWSTYFIVDPILPDGTVDYENVKHINTAGGVLQTTQEQAA